jgi:lipopolysaccharide transport system ATP-binding protein
MGMTNAKKKYCGALAVSCTGLSKYFEIKDEGDSWRLLLGLQGNGRTFKALEGVSLQVPKGRFVGILGRNGAGKSTLLRTLGGVYSPSAGKIAIDGTVSGLFELGGFGNQYLTGQEYARRFLSIFGAKRDQMAVLLADVRDFSELGDYFDKRVHTYSAGMAARLYFATATALQCDVYLVDEMLSVGDEHFQAKCWQRLRDRFANGASGILVTHDWSAIMKVCEEAYIIEHGCVIESGRADRVVQSYLNLPCPATDIAHFRHSNHTSYAAVSGKDTELPFQIEIIENVPVCFGYSIELLRIGHGWEILLLGNLMSVEASPGQHLITLRIPRLPLAPGQYSLNVFLTSPLSAYGTVTAYDSKTWTRGNGLDLVVTGNARESATILPMTWNRLDASRCTRI